MALAQDELTDQENGSANSTDVGEDTCEKMQLPFPLSRRSILRCVY